MKELINTKRENKMNKTPEKKDIFEKKQNLNSLILILRKA